MQQRLDESKQRDAADAALDAWSVAIQTGALLEMIIILEAKLEEMQQFVTHLPDCSYWNSGASGAEPCDCGLCNAHLAGTGKSSSSISI